MLIVMWASGMVTSWKASGNADFVILASKLNFVRLAELLTLL
jgi:hypothetical protein